MNSILLTGKLMSNVSFNKTRAGNKYLFFKFKYRQMINKSDYKNYELQCICFKKEIIDQVKTLNLKEKQELKIKGVFHIQELINPSTNKSSTYYSVIIKEPVELMNKNKSQSNKEVFQNENLEQNKGEIYEKFN